MTVRRKVNLDWFNVSYRSVFTVVLFVVLLGGAGVWAYSFYLRSGSSEASEAIARARSRLAEAAALSGDESFDDLILRAKGLLRQADGHFDESAFEEAQVSAIRSETLSQKAIDMIRGDDEDRHAARFYRLEGDVRVKRSGEFSWESADRDMRLREGDQIKTSSSASVQLIYFDGTVTTILPGSLLEIRELHENPATKVRKVQEKLSWGEVVAATKKRNVDGSFHEVTTEKVAARSEEAGEFRVTFDKDTKAAAFDVFQGRIQVASAERRESVNSGERIRAAANGSLLRKESLPAAPRLLAPADQRVLTFDDPSKSAATLTWDRVAGAKRYHLQISDKALFTDSLYAADRIDTSVEIDGVAEGTYFWKVAAIGENGVRGPFSTPRTFTVAWYTIRDREDKTPPSLEITEAVPAGAMLIINGRTEPGAQIWIDNERVDVSDDGSFYSVVRLRREGLNELTLVAQDAAGNERRLVHKAYVDHY